MIDLKAKLNYGVVTTREEADAVLFAFRNLKKRTRRQKARDRHATDTAGIIKTHAPRLSSRLASLMRRAGRKVARQAAELFAARKLAKAGADDVLNRMLDDLHMYDIAVDIIDLLRPEAERAFREAEATAVASLNLDVSTDQIDEAAKRYADERGAELVTEIEETTRDSIRSLISDAIDEGWSPQKLADEIQGDTAFSDYRSDMIARTELAYAHVGGNMEAWRATDVVEQKQWVVGDGCCPDCQDLDGVTIPIDQDFDYVDGPVDAPPAHPNCRCDVLPVVADDEDADNQQENDE